MRAVSASAYEPLPGSLPDRAIRILQDLPAGTWKPNAELAEELGCKPASMAALMATALKGGALRKRRMAMDLRLTEWALGDGTPEPGPPPDEPLEPVVRPLRPVPVSAFDAARIVARAESEPQPEPPVERRFKRDPKPEPVATEFRAGLFTDGTLLIESGGVSVTLNADQMRQLRSLIAAGAP